MKKTFYTFKKDQPVPTVIRNYTHADMDALIKLQRAAFPPPFPDELLWQKEQLKEHIERFPDGALCVEVDGTIAGSMTTLRVNLAEGEVHTWSEVTDDGYIKNHQPDGDSLYVVDICVNPAYRELGLGKHLMNAMYETVVYLGAKRLIGGSRMPGYSAVQHELSPDQYVEEVTSGKRKDPVVTFLLKCGRMPVGLMPDYLEDEESADHAVIMEWKNPFYEK